jgi:hypothetical protein
LPGGQYYFIRPHTHYKYKKSPKKISTKNSHFKPVSK